MKTLTPEERKRIDQLQLRIDRIKEGFDVQAMDASGEWRDVNNPEWHDQNEYRRKPAPRFAPWTREDGDEWRGIWIIRDGTSKQYQIVCFDPIDETVGCGFEWFTFGFLLSNYKKLDGTPCGKEEK